VWKATRIEIEREKDETPRIILAYSLPPKTRHRHHWIKLACVSVVLASLAAVTLYVQLRLSVEQLPTFATYHVGVPKTDAPKMYTTAPAEGRKQNVPSESLSSRMLSSQQIEDMAAVLPRGESHCIRIISPAVINEADRNERRKFSESLLKPFKKALWDFGTADRAGGQPADWTGVILWSQNPTQPDVNYINKAFDQAPNIYLRNEHDQSEFGAAFMMTGYTYPSEEVQRRITARNADNKTSCPVLYVGSK
jgi:hypothetical protein